MRALLTLNGAMARPRVAYALNADRLVMSGTGLDRLPPPVRREVDAGHVIVPVAAHAARITGLDTVAGGSLATSARPATSRSTGRASCPTTCGCAPTASTPG
jgi:translocation and assembly module TamB